LPLTAGTFSCATTLSPPDSSVNLCNSVASFRTETGILQLHGINGPPHSNGIDWGTYTVEITATASNGQSAVSSYNVTVVDPCDAVAGVTFINQNVKPGDMTTSIGDVD